MRDPDRPRWRCGETGCRAHRRWQPVSALGEFDDMDVALGDLEAHYTTVHPESDVEGVVGRAQLAAAV